MDLVHSLTRAERPFDTLKIAHLVLQLLDSPRLYTYADDSHPDATTWSLLLTQYMNQTIIEYETQVSLWHCSCS